LGSAPRRFVPASENFEYVLGADRHGYLVPLSGMVEINGVRLKARDGAAIFAEMVLRVTAIDDAGLVLIEATRTHPAPRPTEHAQGDTA
jgi:redox-sensitive bicupin YhaK (pirin superfamily)